MESQIMEEATRLFADRGFAGTSLQDIADATGLTRPALYHYFGSKEELLSRLVSELTEGPADELGEIRRRTGTTATERLRATGVTTHIIRPGFSAAGRLRSRASVSRRCRTGPGLRPPSRRRSRAGHHRPGGAARPGPGR